MKELQDRILKDGQVIGTNILKVNKFINHQVDPVLMEHIGEDFANHFADKGITKVVTIESSGIAPALMAAAKMNVPLVILKKQPSKTLHNDLYQTQVTSFTTEKSYELTLSRDVISEDDNILLIDDFMADGEAATGAIRLLRMAHATVAGIGILIEKSFQPGRRKINEQGYEVYSLARIKYMDEYQIDFIEENYTLEVSSPGADRKLTKEREFLYYIGREVDVKLYKAENGVKEFTGVLKDYKDKTAFVELDGEVKEIPVKQAVYIRLSFKF